MNRVPDNTLPPLQSQLYKELLGVARAHEPCPTNAELAKRCGSAVGSVADALGRLRRKGIVKVDTRGRFFRIVTLIFVGVSTAPPPAPVGDNLSSWSEGLHAALRAQARRTLFGAGNHSERIIPSIRFATCQWPVRDPAPDDTFKCGEETDSRGVYCAKHQAKAYQRFARPEAGAKP